MLNLETGIDSLTKFKRQTAEFLERLHETGEPLVLTVNGKAAVVVQDAAAYQRLLAAAAIREGLADVAAGRVKPVRQAIAKLAKKHGIRAARK